LLQNTVLRAGRNVIPWFSGNRYPPRLRRVFKLAVATTCIDPDPTVGFNQSNDIANGHWHDKILPWSYRNTSSNHRLSRLNKFPPVFGRTKPSGSVSKYFALGTAANMPPLLICFFNLLIMRFQSAVRLRRAVSQVYFDLKA
jgi:hypothetical protein